LDISLNASTPAEKIIKITMEKSYSIFIEFLLLISYKVITMPMDIDNIKAMAMARIFNNCEPLFCKIR
jgi:hypothetical protein